MVAIHRPWLDDALRQLAVQAEEDRQKAKEREAKLKLAMEHARKEAAVARMKVTNSVQAKEERRKWRQSVREARKKATEEKKREVRVPWQTTTCGGSLSRCDQPSTQLSLNDDPCVSGLWSGLCTPSARAPSPSQA